jgi:uncharacterized DUF497 family protein
MMNASSYSSQSVDLSLLGLSASSVQSLPIQRSAKPSPAEQTVWQGQITPALVRRAVAMHEVEEAFASAVSFQVLAAGNDGHHEGVYLRLGQTQAGRLLAILFAYRGTRNAWILSARDMAEQESCYYRQCA